MANQKLAFFGRLPRVGFVTFMDNQTVASTAIGGILTITTFYVAYRKTVGAREEKVRRANHEILKILINIVAVEQQSITIAQFEEMRITKAYEHDIKQKRIWDYSKGMASLTCAVLENDFVSAEQRKSILGIISSNRGNDERKPADEVARTQQYSVGIDDKFAGIGIAVLSSLLVAASYFLVVNFAAENREMLRQRLYEFIEKKPFPKSDSSGRKEPLGGPSSTAPR